MIKSDDIIKRKHKEFNAKIVSAMSGSNSGSVLQKLRQAVLINKTKMGE